MEDIIALLVTVIPLSLGSIWFLGKTAFGQAIVRRIEGRNARDAHDVDVLHDEVQQLREQVMQLRDENTEMLERLDFAERLLTRARNVTPQPEEIVSGEN